MNLESSTFSVLISFIVAILVSGLFYLKDKKLNETASWLKLALTSCRFFIVFILVFLLFKPLTTKKKEELMKSVFPVLLDNSKSVVISNSSLEGEILNFTNELKSTFANTNVKIIPFSNGLQVGDSLDFSNQGTNISKSLSEIKALFPASNIGSALVISDGIITEGSKDINLNQIPLYSIGIGDSVKHPDAFIKSLFHNDITFLGNEFELELNLKFKELKAENQVVEVYYGNDLVKQITFIPKSNNVFKKCKIKVKANKSGEIPIKVVLNNKVKEKNKVNNFKTSFITVKDKKLNLLLVQGAPTPDIRLVKSAFFGVEHVKLNTTSFNNLDYDLSKTSVVVFIGDGELKEQSAWLNKIVEKRIGFLWLTGVKGAFKNDFFELTRLDNSFDEVRARLNKGFSKFKLGGGILEGFSSDLPISVPFGKWKIKGEQEVFSYQSINGIDTDLPLIAFSQLRGVQFGLLIGEGFWRLGLKEKFGLAEFLRKSIDAVAVKVDDSKFQLFSRKSYYESEDVVFIAKYWNQAGELDNSGEVEAKLIKGDSLLINTKLLKTSNDFSFNFGNLKEGVYQLKTTFRKGNLFLNKKVSFVVKAIKVESENLVANHSFLKRISNQNNGKFYHWDQRSKLINDLRSSKNFKSISYFESISDLLIKHKWILFLLIGLISIEWFIRKWQGTI